MKDHVQQVHVKNIFLLYTKILLYIQMNQSLKWIMDAMARVKMNSRNEQPPDLKLLSVDDDDVPESAPTTMISSL
jgi:hypothetical protein